MDVSFFLRIDYSVINSFLVVKNQRNAVRPSTHRSDKLHFEWRKFVPLVNIRDALRHSAPFIKFKKRERHQWRSITFTNFTKS